MKNRCCQHAYGQCYPTNSNGVIITQTSNGGTARTKDGMGVAQVPGRTTCVKDVNYQGCRK